MEDPPKSFMAQRGSIQGKLLTRGLGDSGARLAYPTTRCARRLPMRRCGFTPPIRKLQLTLTLPRVEHTFFSSPFAGMGNFAFAREELVSS